MILILCVFVILFLFAFLKNLIELRKDSYFSGNDLSNPEIEKLVDDFLNSKIDAIEYHHKYTEIVKKTNLKKERIQKLKKLNKKLNKNVRL